MLWHARPAQVRGPDALRAFSRFLVEPYQGPDSQGGKAGAAAAAAAGANGGDAAQLQQEVQRLRARVAELEQQLVAAQQRR